MIRRSTVTNTNVSNINPSTNVPLYIGLVWLILLNLFIGGGVLTPPALAAATAGANNAVSPNNGSTNAAANTATTATSPATAAQASRARQAYSRLPLTFETNAGQTDGQVRYLARGQGYSLFFTDDGTATLDLRKSGPGQLDDSAAPHGNGKGRGKNKNSNQTQAVQVTGSDGENGADDAPVAGIALALKLIGSKPTGQPVAEKPLAATSNYFTGANPAQWQTGLKNYGQLTYKGVYQGIDLSYTGQQEQLEYQFTLAPGADVSQIAFTFDGVSKATLQSDGSLLLGYGSEKITQPAPTIYQTDPTTGQQHNVAGGFTLVEKPGSGNGNGKSERAKGKLYQIGFKLTGSYDPSQPLVIDPVLSYSTFIGGAAIDSGQSIKVDSSGNAYVVGYTLASDFPTTVGAYQASYNDGNTGGYDAFVTKLNSTGTGLVYSTYLGGNGIDYGLGLDVDNSGLVYLTGATDSTNFPTTSGAYSTTLAVAGGDSMFVARLSATGSLNYATLIGGDGGDYGRAIVVDKSNPNRVFVAGEGFGANGLAFPTTANALVKRPEGGNGAYDGLLLQLDLSQSGAAQLVYSSYFGGNGEDVIYGLAVDTATSPARFYITGYTTSTNMSVTNVAVGSFGAGYQTAKGSAPAGQDAFVAVLSPGTVSTTLLYSSYLGGTGDEIANGLSLDANKNIYIVGQTTSVGTGSAAFPTTAVNALRAQPLSGATQQGFLTVLNPALTGSSQLLYSTYLGGSKADRALAVVADPTSANARQVYVSGVGNSSDLPVSAGAFQPTISVTNGITGDHGFVMKLDTTKSGSASLVYGTHLGGSTSYKDRVAAIAIDGSGNAYVTGWANSTDFPVTNGAFQTRSTDGYEAFVSKLNPTGTALSYSTYLGGGSKDSGGGVAVGSDGSMYLAGQTNASIFPANTGVYTATTPNSNPNYMTYQDYHLYAVRLAPDGSGLIYATYIGGSGNDQPTYGVGLDSSGNFYFGGNTTSTDFPTTAGAYNTGYGTGVTLKSVALKLNPSGGLAYSTYFGGNNSTVVRGVTVSPDGSRLYLAGSTSSDATAFPLKGAYQTTYGGGNDAFVAVLNPAGSGANDLVNSTYLGGSGSDGANAVALDGLGGIYVMGTTSAPATTPFPTVNAYQSSLSAAAASGSNAVFVSKLTTNGSGQLGLAYSTYLGGNTGNTGGRGLVVDSSGSAYVMGFTTASNFPTTTNAYQTNLKGTGDLFVTKFTPGGNSLAYSTYLGGNGVENCGNYALVLDTQVVSQVIGAACTSADFPATPAGIAYQTSSGGGNDAVVFKLNTAASGASSLAYSTYLGGSGNDAATGVGVDRLGNIYVGGTTGSSDFPTTAGAYQVTSRGGGDSFAAKINQLKLVFNPSPGNNTPANALLSPQPVVQVQSLLTSAVITAYNGPITLTIKAGTGAPGAVLSGTTVITAVSGVATFTNLSINLPGTGYVLTARGSLIDPADSTPFNVGAAAGQPASIVVYSGSGQSAQVSTTFAAPLVAQVKDAYNNPVSGAVVTFTAPVVATSASGIFTGGVSSATATTIANGTATAPSFNANGYVGSYVVTATVSGVLTPASFTLTNTAQPIITPTLVFTRQVSGAVAGSVFVTQPVVTALNPDSSVATGFNGPVAVSIKTGSGTPNAVLTGTTTLTATAGVVTYTNLSINLAGQNYILTAASPGLTSTDSLPFTVTAAPIARIVAVGGTPQSTQVNTTFAAPLVAQVFDTNNQPVSGVVVTFQAPVLANSASGVFTGGVTSATATTDSTGKATAPIFTANAITGTYTVTATVSGVITPASFVLTNTAQPLPTLVFTRQVDGAVAGSLFITQPVVKALNSDSSVATSFNGPVSVSIKAGSGTPNAVLTGTTTLTATAGVVTYTDLSINLAGQNYVLTAASPGLTSTDSLPFTVTAAPIARIVAVGGTPQSTQVNTVFTNSLVAQVFDTNNQPVSGAVVTFQAPVGVGSASGTFTGGVTSATATTDITGKATAPTFTANAITGTYTVTATVSGVITPASFVLTNTAQPPVPTSLVFNRQPDGAVAGSVFVTQPIVAVLNNDGTPATGFSGPISVSIKPGSGTPNALLSGTTTLTATAGVVTYTNLAIDLAGQNYVLTAASPGLTSTDSLPFTVTQPISQPATIIAVAGTPQSTLISTPFATALAAQVLDAHTQPISGAVVTFQAPVVSGSASGTFTSGVSSITATTDSTGTATAPTFTANAITGTYTVTATVSGVITPASFVLTNTAQPPVPASLVFNRQPDGAVAGSVFVTQPVVAVLNSDGTPATGFSGAISVSIKPGSGTANAVLAGTTTLTATAGVVTYTDLSINLAGPNYVLTAASPGLTSTDSLPFTVTQVITEGGAPARIIATSGTPQSAVINTAFSEGLTAQVVDANSQPVSGVVVTFQAPAASSGPAATFGATADNATVTTNNNGFASVSGLLANGTTGSFVVTASVSGVITPAVFNLTNISTTTVLTPTDDAYRIELNPPLFGPDPLGITQTMTARLLKHDVVPIKGRTLEFTVSGANPTVGTATTDDNGYAFFTYTGNTAGQDTIQASVVITGQQVRSNPANILWSSPLTITTAPVTGLFFNPGGFSFNITPNTPPAFSQTFPSILFNPEGLPPAYKVCPSFLGCGFFKDVVTDENGNPNGVIKLAHEELLAKNNTFQAVFLSQFIVPQSGWYTITINADDAYILGVGNGAVAGSSNIITPTALSSITPFKGYPVMGAHNICCADGEAVSIYFPAAGIYPYELDYAQGYPSTSDPRGVDDESTLVMLLNGAGIPPAGRLVISPVDFEGQPASKLLGADQTYVVTATLSSGSPAANYNVVLDITSDGFSKYVTGTTDSAGVVTFTYTQQVPSHDVIQAHSWIDGQPVQSSQTYVNWQAAGPSPADCPNPPLAVPGWLGAPGKQSIQFTQFGIKLNADTTLKPNALLEYAPANDLSHWTPLTTTQVTQTAGTVLANFDTTVVPNGSYIIRLVGFNAAGFCQGNQILVDVEGEYKPGRVQFTLTDLTVPVAGLPIQIGRTYDSLERGSQGDFGYGWSLAIGTPKLSVNPAGDVTLTKPGGERVTFQFAPRPVEVTDTFLGSAPINLMPFILVTKYLPQAGEYGTLRANTDSCQAFVALSGGYYCFPSTETYFQSILSYDYTDPYGRVYNLSPNGKLNYIRDLNDNKLTFGPDGITSSAGGRKVSFVRDASNGNRITEVIDPQLNHYHYNYDSDGNLQYVTFPTLPSEPTSVITYSYAITYPHLFQSALDSLGHRAVLNTFYTSDDGAALAGRLKSVVDGQGYETSYRYDLGGRTFTTFPDSTQLTTTFNFAGRVFQTTDQLARQATYTYVNNDPVNSTSVDYQHPSCNPNSGTVSVPCPSWQLYEYAKDTPYDSRGNKRGESWIYTPPTNPAPGTPSPAQYATLTDFNYYGGPITMTDKTGVTKTVSYDENFMPLSVQDTQGSFGGYAFDEHGNVTSRQDGNGKATTFSYDQYGNKLSESDPLSRTTYNSYDDLGRVISSTNPAGGTTQYGYDPLGQTLAMTTTVNNAAEGTSASYVTTYRYDANGNKLSETVPGNAVTTFSYDNDNRLHQQTGPDGTVKTTDYDWRGHVLTETVTKPGSSEAAHVTVYNYDEVGRLITTTTGYGTPQAASVSKLLSDQDFELSSQDANGNVITNSYLSGRPDWLTGKQLPNNLGFISYDYDTNRRLTRTSQVYKPSSGDGPLDNEIDQATEYGYNGRGQLVTTTNYPRGQGNYGGDSTNVETQAYDLAGHLNMKTDAKGNSTVYVYNDAGQLVSVSRPIDKAQAITQTTNYDYDALGNLKWVQDANGHSTSYGYDTMGRLITKTWPAATPTAQAAYEQYFYEDAAGNLTTIRTRDGHYNHFQYDWLRRLTKATYWDGQTIEYSYTALGQQETVTQTVGSTVRVSHYTYDGQNRLASIATSANGGAPNLVSYGYDPVGNRTAITTPVGTVSYTYNAINQISDVYSQTADVANPAHTHYDYDILNRRQSASLPNGIVVKYTYDLQNRLTDLVEGKNGAATLYNYHYVYDEVGNRTAATESGSALASSRNLSWQYDDAYRLLSETDAAGGTTKTTSFTYDYTGNRQSMTVGDGTAAATTGYGYNNLDQLLVVTPTAGSPVMQYSYDGRGNLTQTTTTGGTQTTAYQFDALDRLVILTSTVAGSGGNPAVAHYGYDYAGRRVQQAISGAATGNGTTNYLWDEASQYGDVLMESDGTTGNPLVSYVLAGGELISQDKPGSGSGSTTSTSYYLKDGLGSVRALTGGDGSILSGEQYSYDAFGNLQSGAPTNPTSHYLYTGQQYDQLSGLYDLRARYYNPQDGRFLIQDTFPLNPGNPTQLNRYVYVANNPATLIDPSGWLAVDYAETTEEVSQPVEEGQAEAVIATGGYTKEGLVIAQMLVGAIIGLGAIILIASQGGPTPQPSPGGSGACKGSACPTPTPNDTPSTEDKIAAAYQAATSQCVAQYGTTFLKCDVFANLFVKELAKRGLTGNIITLKGTSQRMYSTRWKNGTEEITTNAIHQGVEVNGQVYDNLSSYPMPSVESWRLTFEAEIQYPPDSGRYILGPPPIVPNP